MTENDEGAVSTDGNYVLRSDHERIVTALRARLAAAEAARDSVRASLGDGPGVQAEEIRRLRGSLAMVRKLASEDATKLQAQRDQALTRLGEAEKMIVKWREWTAGLRNDGHDSACAYIRHADECSCGFWELLTPTDQFLARDSAGGMG